jgi:RNA polymerase sigma factor (sigma-70 family)
LGAFVRDHAALLHAAVVRVLGPRGGASGVEPEDVVQAVFQKLWEDGRRRLRGFQGKSRLSTWLVAVAQRTALDRVPAPVAATQSLERVGEGAVADAAARNGHAPVDALGGAAARDETRALEAALEALPPATASRAMVHLDGRSYGEVARLLAVPENSICRGSRARARPRTVDRRTDPPVNPSNPPRTSPRWMPSTSPLSRRGHPRRLVDGGLDAPDREAAEAHSPDATPVARRRRPCRPSPTARRAGRTIGLRTVLRPSPRQREARWPAIGGDPGASCVGARWRRR